MDRVSRSLALCSFGLILTASGCRTTRPEVPPGRPYSSDGRQRPAIGFSTDPHPVNGAAMTNIMPDSAGASKLTSGFATGSSPTTPPPTVNAYGQPTLGGQANDLVADSTRGTAPNDDAVVPAGAPAMPRPRISPTPNPATLPADAAPQPEPAAPASQAVQPVLENGGQMGRPNDYPSPN